MKYFIVSVMPPSLGGMASHGGNLSTAMTNRGWDVHAFDPYSGRKSNIDQNYKIATGGKIIILLSLLKSTFRFRPQAVHFHLAAGANLPFLIPLFIFIKFFSQVVVTVHSGNAPDKLSKLSTCRRLLTIFALRLTDQIICVNSQIHGFIAEWAKIDEKRIHTITPFIPLKLKTDERRIQNSRFTLLLAGSDHELYGWDISAEALDIARGPYNIHVAFYGRDDRRCFDHIVARFKSKQNSHQFIFHYNLSSAEFLELLSTVDCYLRPTWSDGDSMAVRESISLQTPVIASSVVSRPEGCLLFNVNSAAELSEAIIFTETNPVLNPEINNYCPIDDICKVLVN